MGKNTNQEAAVKIRAFFEKREGRKPVPTSSVKEDPKWYNSVHGYIWRRKPKQDTCEHCGKAKKLQASLKPNAKYDLDIDLFDYLCGKCHSIQDDVSERMKETWKSPELRAKRSAAAKKLWKSPEFRKKRDAGINTPECKEKKAAAMKEQWQDPEYIEKMSAVRKEMWKKPEFRAKRLATFKKTRDKKNKQQKILES